MAIISFATRYLLSNEAASSFVELMKHLSPENKILQDLTTVKIVMVSFLVIRRYTVARQLIAQGK